MRSPTIRLKNKKEIARLRDAGKLVAETFEMLREYVQPGAKLSDLDRIAEEFIVKHKGKVLYKGYGGGYGAPPFPGTICASVNEEICHGIPDDRVLKEGDIIGVDIGVRLHGWCGDSCITYPVGEISSESQRLLDVAEKALYVGIRAAKPNHHLHDIGAAIQDFVEAQGMSVVREWGGHGIGRELHEPPSVSHVRMPTRGPKLRPGMVLNIEPMVNLGRYEWLQLDDGWTVITRDHSLSAQFEHTVVITPRGPEILSKL